MSSGSTCRGSVKLAVDPYDEIQIAADDCIIRRINPAQHVIWDDNRKRRRIASKAYSKSSGLKDGMSVDIEALIVSGGETPQKYVTTPVFTGSVAFTAKEIRALNLIIGYEPIRGIPGVTDNPYHGEVWSKTESKRFTSQQKDGLARSARWYVVLPNVDLI